MVLRLGICLAVLCCAGIVIPLSSAGEVNEDIQILHAAGVAVDGPALLDFFRKRTANEAMIRRAEKWIADMASDSFAVREKSSRELRALGPAILPLLRRTIRDTSDLEVRRRARRAVETIQVCSPAALAEAAARLLTRRRPAGAVETLLTFLPCPYDGRVPEAIQDALVTLARFDGRSHSAFVAALTSSVSERRIAAAVALCRLGSAAYWPSVRTLLRDEETKVRWRAAEELASAGDKQAVPVLIELLAQLPAQHSATIEELLYRLAGVSAPRISLGVEPEAHVKRRDIWRAWWQSNGDFIAMSAIRDRQRPLGYTLLVLLNANRVVEWDRDGKARWQINGLASPLDAEVLPGGRVLIAEYDGKRVTERNLKGEVLWEKKLNDPPIHVQRLPNGVTFIATRRRLLEVDRAGKSVVVRYRSNNNGIITACRYRDGRIGCIEKGTYFELDAGGKERKHFTVVSGVFTTNSLTPLVNGNLLIASYAGGSVQEYDRSGKIVWRVKMGRPLCAVRLANGNTLVSTQDMVLVEYDRSGKIVARRSAPGHPCQIRRR